MSLVIPIRGWVICRGVGGGGRNFGGGKVVQKRESPDFRSPEVGISVIMSKSRKKKCFEDNYSLTTSTQARMSH